MQISIQADHTNTKTILTLLEEMGYSLPCNCHGSHLCDGRTYPFDCSLVPVEPVTITLPPSVSGVITGISLEDMVPVNGTGDTILIDLGTTTVAMALMDSTSGELRQTCVFANPQKQFGSDVISRIHASLCSEKDTLTSTIRKAIAEHAALLCKKNRQEPDEPAYCYIGGNTAMIHILMGYDCTPLSRSPFTPLETAPPPFLYKSCRVWILPWFSAFVGGDVTAGMYACHMEPTASYRNSDTVLLMDLGTNGEMLLRHNGQFYSAATAAGPAFEGNGLSCGCPGIPGAISKVRLTPLRPRLTTIADRLPVGICGSGAVSLCAELLHRGCITPDGVLTDRFPSQGILLGHSPAQEPLYFTAEDLRQIQLSIAAIAAGIDTLACEAGISPSDITNAYLGGGFGFYLDLESCQTLGLFSSIPISHIEPMGNTCLRGLFRCACCKDDSTRLTVPAAQTVDLAENPFFRQQFISHMTYSG